MSFNPGTPAMPTATGMDIIEAALVYASVGLRPFPLKAGGKTPWPRLTGWPDRATCDPATVWRLFEGKVDANLGLAMGRGVMALDLDAEKGGLESVHRLVDGHGLPVTAVAVTGGGGQHHLFRTPDELVVRNAVGVLPGLDVRGHRGFIAAWPSVHPNGNRYAWQRHPAEGIADAPDWLIATLPLDARPRGTAKKGAATGAKATTVVPKLDRTGDPAVLASEAIARFPSPGLDNATARWSGSSARCSTDGSSPS